MNEQVLPGAAAGLAMDDLPGGFLICRMDRSGVIIRANQELLRILQCETMEELRTLTGNSIWGIIYPEDLAEAEHVLLERDARQPEQAIDISCRVCRRDGSVRQLEGRGWAVRSEDGPLLYLLLSDVTGRRERQLAEHRRLLAEAQARADAAVAAKNTFLSNMSHDMRTPLNAIFGFITLAKRNIHNPEEALENLEQVETSSRLLLEMIDEVLQISSLSHAARPAEVPCDLPEALDEVFAFLEPQAQEKGIDFTVHWDARHRGVYANRDSFKQLALNLANNALTYTDPGGRVSLSLTEEDLPGWDSIYRLVVEDTGIGISEEFLEQIFEPFIREKNSTLSGVHGIGLGLTIAKGLVEKMGGTIGVKSTVGKGSTFTATLRFRTQSHRSVGPAVSSLRLLLVEDNEINREIATDLLENMGFLIDPAENGQEALEKVSRSAPGGYDLIIMDLQMPVMDGWEASAAIRALPDPALANIPIVALSANALDEDRRKSRESGIDVHLAKPMDVPVLLDTIEALTGRRLGDRGGTA